MLSIIISVCTYMYNHLVSSLSSSIYVFIPTFDILYNVHGWKCTVQLGSPIGPAHARDLKSTKRFPAHPSVSLIRSTRPCLNISISCPAVSPNEPLTFTEKSGQTAWSLIRHPSVLSAILPSICQFFSTSFHLSVNSSIFSSICQFFSTVLCSLSSICQ